MATPATPIRAPAQVPPEMIWAPPRDAHRPVLPDIQPYRWREGAAESAQEQRRRAGAMQDLMEREYQFYGPMYGAQEQRYRELSDVAYAPLLAGRAGYSPEEQRQILRTGELRGLQMTPEELAEIGLTPRDAAAIQGDPNAAFNYYNPRLMRGMAESAGARQREGFAEAQRGIRGAAYDPGLELSPEFRQAQRATLSRLRGDVSGAIDPSALRLTPGFAESYPLTDEEIASAETLASQTAGARFGAENQDIMRQARASGMLAPAARAAIGQNLRMRAAQEGADAATRARLGGLELQRGQRLQAELARLQAEQGLSDRQLRAAFGLGETGIGAMSDIERIRAGLAGQRAGLRTGAEQYLAGTRQNIERDISGRQLGTERFLQPLGMEQARYAEAERSGRARDIYGLGQEAARYRQGQRYGRGLDVSDRLSGRARDIAQERIGQEREARGYLTGQQQYSGDRFGDERRLRLEGYRIPAQVQAEATRAQIARRGTPGGAERIFGGLVGGASSYFGSRRQ